MLLHVEQSGAHCRDVAGNDPIIKVEHGKVQGPLPQFQG